MGSRLISISFDKIYRIVKLCSLNGIFVASQSAARCPLYLRVCILLAVCVCVYMCVWDCEGAHQTTFTASFATICGWQKRNAEQPAKHSIPSHPIPSIHLCLNCCKQKAAFVWILGSEFGLVGSCGSCSSRFS